MKLTRREFAKAQAAAIAALAAGMPLTSAASNLLTDADLTSLDWNKAPCRFCGTGCGVMVATKDGTRGGHPRRHARPRSTAASTASRATSCRRSCMAATA